MLFFNYENTKVGKLYVLDCMPDPLCNIDDSKDFYVDAALGRLDGVWKYFPSNNGKEPIAMLLEKYGGACKMSMGAEVFIIQYQYIIAECGGGATT